MKNHLSHAFQVAILFLFTASFAHAGKITFSGSPTKLNCTGEVRLSHNPLSVVLTKNGKVLTMRLPKSTLPEFRVYPIAVERFNETATSYQFSGFPNPRAHKYKDGTVGQKRGLFLTIDKASGDAQIYWIDFGLTENDIDYVDIINDSRVFSCRN